MSAPRVPHNFSLPYELSLSRSLSLSRARAATAIVNETARAQGMLKVCQVLLSLSLSRCSLSLSRYLSLSRFISLSLSPPCSLSLSRYLSLSRALARYLPPSLPPARSVSGLKIELLGFRYPLRRLLHHPTLGVRVVVKKQNKNRRRQDAWLVENEPCRRPTLNRADVHSTPNHSGVRHHIAFNTRSSSALNQSIPRTIYSGKIRESSKHQRESSKNLSLGKSEREFY